MSRHSSPDNEFVDVETTERPHSSASGTSQKQSGPQIIAALPEVKRNRGRPRKFKETSEEGECNLELTAEKIVNFVSTYLICCINMERNQLFS